VYALKKDNNNNIKCIIDVYLDNIIISGTDTEIKKTKGSIKNNFEATDIGEIDFIIGTKFIKCKEGYFIHKIKYSEEDLNKFYINKYSPISNTMLIGYKELRNK